MKEQKQLFWKYVRNSIIVVTSLLSFVQCTSSHAEKEPAAPKTEQIVEVQVPIERPINYQLVATKDTIDWLTQLQPGDTMTALMVINRVDGWRLKHLDTLVFPDTIGAGIDMYSPFPKRVDSLRHIHKIIFVSHYAQAFSVYENGECIKWGPVNLGTKYGPTPVGLFATNWKAKRTTSTVNPTWILDWYFNIANYDGIGMHQYALPGYPASHGCIRMYREDAKWLYYWADQWIIENSKITVYGTPVVIFGEYPYGGQKPWWLLANDNKALEHTPEALFNELDEFLPTILERQMKRDSVELLKLAPNV